MASLRDVVSEYQDDLRNGIAWLAFWREGRSWQAEAFHLDLDDTLYPEDRARLAEIQAADPRAIVVNGYYSGYLSEEMSVAELAAGVRHHYDNGLNNIAPFMEAHSDELPPDVLEAAREKAHAAGLPFYERPYRGDDIDPYSYDGHMSIEDYELMQKLMEQDRERSEPMSEVFSILLHNRQRYEQGKEGLWFSLPTTTEKLQEALREIGISADNPQDFFLYDYRSPQERPIKLPRDLVLSADVDELNFLAARLEKLDAAELSELNAALTSPQSDFHSIGQIIDYPDNVDYYVHLPDVTGTGQLGDYYLNRSGMVDMPEEWKAGIFLPRFGLHIANTEHGVFTDYGYLVKSGDEWQRVHEGQPVPEEYRVMAYPAPEILRDEAPARTVQPEVAPTAEAAAPPPVVPIILNSQNSADRMKEITDRLETGIQELFESERYKAYLTSMSKFHSYSFNNTLLIAMQGGQLVAGYNKWRDDFHRNVKRGEKGIKILAPAPYKVKKEVPKLDEQGQPVMDKDGNPVTEKKEIQVPAFKIVSVFDVSQTEGEPLPSIGVDELAGSVEQYEDFFKALEQTSPVPMAFEDIPGGSHGYYHLTEKRIAIQENMSELQTLKTAIHEIAHAKLHAIDPETPVTEQADRPDSRTREVQAESVAYAVCQHYGLDTSDYSFGYVAGWSSGKDLKELRASLETIRATAHELITTIDGHLAELQQQRQAQQTVEQAAEQPAPGSVFSKLPPEQQQEMTDSVKAMLQTLIDADVKSTGEVTQGTLDAIQTQGFVLSGDGTLQQAEAQPEPQPWNGIDGLLNNKPIMPEATPTERANALIDWAERDGQRMGNEERRLIVEYAEAVDNTDKVIALINELCEHGYEMQHGHVDELVKSRIDREIAEAKAAQQPTLDPTAEPVVTILFTESPHLEMGQQMPLHEADALFARLDAEHRGGGYYDKTDFRIDFTFQGEPHSYSGRQDFGDRDGSLIEHIREYQTFYLNDEKWKDHLTRQGGPEAWAEDHASREAFLTEIIPYMELHCNLSRLEQEAQTRLASSDTLTPEETAYYGALVDYAMECRPLLNHGEPLPEMPKLTDFDQSLQDYKAQVEAEIAQEAADAGMTVEEYAAAGYEAPAQPQEVKEPPQQEAPEQPTKEPAASDYYYSINEGAARRAKEMNSYSDYKPGSATAEYRHYVDEAFALAQEQKRRVDPMYHEKIDSLLDTYARKLAANMNHGYEIDARVPSILIAGGSNFPVRQKEKQNAARDSNMQEWQYIQGLLDKIRSTGMGGIRQDDPQAIPKLQKKLAGLEKAQETMKAVNAYYRKHGTLDGCPHLSPESLENLKADMASGWHYEKKPFQSWELSNNNAEIRRVRQRIESLTRANEVAYVGWEFDGGHVEANRDQGRLQVFFDGKPEADARQQLKEHGFRWAPSVGAWQRLLNDNAYYASDRIACIQPLSGIKPTELQRNSSREQRAQTAQEQAEPDYFYRVHANPRSDSRENLYMLQAYIPQDNGRAKIGDVLYVGTPERCRELMDQLNTGELTQEAVKELYAKEQEQPTQEPAPEPEQEPVQEPEPEITPAQEVTSDAEPQAAPAETLTELQEKALEIADRYKDLPLQAKIDVIAQAFGCKTGEIHTSPCTGKWRGTSDMTIRFDNGASQFIGNRLTPKAKTVKVQTECVNRTLVQYNPEIVKATKEAALPALLQREAKDNEIAAQKGLKPYTLLNVEFNEGADEKTGGYIGWYYVTLAVDGKICTHLETGLNHDIASGKVSDTPTRADYYPAGALKEADVDYVLNNVGFSSASTLYTVPLRDDVQERAEKTLAERSAAAPEQGDIFAIYQIKGGPETRDYRFEAYESLQEAGLAVDRQNYDLVYTAPLDGKTTLEDIYRTFNLDRPADFTGHSLSVSDIVVLTRSGKEEAHYCDSFGFTPVPEFFLQREKQLTPRELLTDESIQTPRGSFLVTDMSREQLEAAGYGFHHQSEDGKYLIMGNGTDAFAIPAQQESPIKAAEMTTEQNYNMIDGVLNNAPTMSELEAKAKAGEQISLFDVAEAAKAEAQKPKQPKRPAQKQKKPSIRAQLKAAKEEQQKKPPQREKAQELEV